MNQGLGIWKKVGAFPARFFTAARDIKLQALHQSTDGIFGSFINQYIAPLWMVLESIIPNQASSEVMCCACNGNCFTERKFFVSLGPNDEIQ